MKLLEKLKNTFFEEEYVEVEEVKKDVAKKIEPKEIKKEEVKITPISEIVPKEEKKIENYSDKELSRKDSKLPYFEEEDFIEPEVTVKKEEKKEKKLYGQSVDNLHDTLNLNTPSYKPYNNPVKEKFKPTPIISPIYGILDKNYRKEEVIDKKEKPVSVSNYVSRKNVDLDSIRKKAYGQIDPIEEKSKELEENIEEESNLLYDMTADNSKPVVNKVTIADAEEYFEDLGLEYNIDYKDSHYEKATGRRVQQPKETEEVKEDSEEANLEDNLFDLIDTIYQEEEE